MALFRNLSDRLNAKGKKSDREQTIRGCDRHKAMGYEQAASTPPPAAPPPAQEIPPDEVEELIGDPGDTTQQLQALRDDTLDTYPPHYQAALRVLQEYPGAGYGWTCIGAMETSLSEKGMEISYDFRKNDPTWRRIVVAVTMNRGTVTDVQVNELAKGQPSGIAHFDRA